jgi:hypothetical protein
MQPADIPTKESATRRCVWLRGTHLGHARQALTEDEGREKEYKGEHGWALQRETLKSAV